MKKPELVEQPDTAVVGGIWLNSQSQWKNQSWLELFEDYRHSQSQKIGKMAKVSGLLDMAKVARIGQNSQSW